MVEDNLMDLEHPFDQLPAIADAVGGKIEIILDGGSKERHTCS